MQYSKHFLVTRLLKGALYTHIVSNLTFHHHKLMDTIERLTVNNGYNVLLLKVKHSAFTETIYLAK